MIHRVQPRFLSVLSVLALGATASLALATHSEATSGRTFAAGAAPMATVQPSGPGGTWSLAWHDGFNGTSLDTTRWSRFWFVEGATQNNVQTHAANVTEGGGHLTLTLASATSGASVTTNPNGGATTGFQTKVGDFAEARIYFPGNGTTIFNWPAWWTDGQSWPTNGENDIAEGLGTMTVNYHSGSGSHNQGTVPGTWSSAYHTYGLYRKANSCDVYYDGVLVKSYPTDDNGALQYLILNVGSHSSGNVFGAAGAMKVDYVRVWR